MVMHSLDLVANVLLNGVSLPISEVEIRGEVEGVSTLLEIETSYFRKGQGGSRFQTENNNYVCE